MNILIYNWKDIKNPLVGGAEIITFEYARRLAADGHQVTWFCRQFPDTAAEELIDGVRVIRRGGFFSTYWQGYLYYRSLTVKPDLVIDMLNTIAWQTPLYARRSSKVVQYVNQLAKEVWDYQLPPLKAWVGKLFEPLQLIPYHRLPVVTYAKSTADDLVEWGYDRSKIKLFSLGLDHQRYFPGPKADRPLFVQVCRLVPNKRPDLTVRAFAEVVKQHPDAQLVLVGTGPYLDELKRMIAELQIEKSVTIPTDDIWFFKKSDGDQKVKLMQSAWAAVHPSVKEGWGMVITEAAACGTPTIATAVTGQVDAIIDGQTGILISKNPTVDELAVAMNRIIEDDALRAKLTAGCLEWAAKFDWEKSYQEFKGALGKATGLDLDAKPAIYSLEPSQWPKITIITPVYNAARALGEYFTALDKVSYPKDKIELIMPDGGSTDQTRNLAERHGAIILDNKLKTAEAGKAVGLHYLLDRREKGPPKKGEIEEGELELICMLDSDNIIVQPDWFERMVSPFLDNPQLVGTEPWQYLYRPTDGYITRYTALLGMSDPLTHFLGNYDRLNILTGRWTDLPIKTSDQGEYLIWQVDPKLMPTVGANGVIFRASFFDSVEIGDYLFDIDVLYKYTLKSRAQYAKVKIGIVHIFCRNLGDFIRKQRRRIQDFHYFHAMGLRHYPWTTINRGGIVKFIISCLTVVPLIWQAAVGFRRHPDRAWLFHPIACWITLFIYGSNAILNHFRPPRLTDRSHWFQA